MSQNLIGEVFDALTSRKGALLAVPAILLLGATVAIGRSPAPEAGSSAGGQAPVVLAQAAPPPAPSAAPKAAEKGPSLFSAEQKAELHNIIKDYLVNNPEVLHEASQALEAKMEQIQAEKMKVGLAANSAAVYRDPKSPVAGNPKGDVTVVEFFDYNCGYCKVALPPIAKLIERDKGVRVVFKEVTFIGRETSAGASRVALAARNQGKYWEVHRGLLELKGTVTEAAALRIAEKAGANMDQLKRDAASAEIRKELEDNHVLAQKLGINGTPFFLVGDRIISGAGETLLENMTSLVAEVRKKGCSVC